MQGLDLAIGLMNIGEICELKIEPRLAYGNKGLPPLIPADAKIIYSVELVSVNDEDETDKLSVTERKTKGYIINIPRIKSWSYTVTVG